MAKPIRTVERAEPTVSWEAIVQGQDEGLEALLKFSEILARAGVFDLLEGILEQKFSIFLWAKSTRTGRRMPSITWRGCCASWAPSPRA